MATLPTTLPDGDSNVGAWLDNAAGAVDLYQKIDEGILAADDSDYIQAPNDTDNADYKATLVAMPSDFIFMASLSWQLRFALSSGTAPGTPTGYLVNHGGGYAAGASSVDVDSGTGTWTNGDKYQFGGVVGTFTITGSVGGGSATNVSFTPSLPVGGVADNATLTKVADDTYGIKIRIVNGATILAAADAAGTFSTVVSSTTISTAFANSLVTAFAFVNNSPANAPKSLWDDAVLEIRQTYTAAGAGDAHAVKVSAVELTGVYFVVKEAPAIYDTFGKPKGAKEPTTVTTVAGPSSTIMY